MSDPSQRPFVTIPRPPVSSTLAPLQPFFPALDSLTPESAIAIRESIKTTFHMPTIIGDRPLLHTEHSIDGPDSTTLLISVFRNSNHKAGVLRPCLLYVHGGGQIFGDRFHLIDFPLSLAADLEAVVIIPEYRVLPEHPSPAAAEDCYAALQWAFDHAQSLGIDSAKVMLGGLSGGAAIAAGTALMWRDRKESESVDTELCGMWLSCPMLDHRGNTPSLLQYTDANITALFLAKAWEFALGKDHAVKEDVSGYSSPAVAKDLSRLPRVFLDVGSAESLRDEVVRFAGRLWEAGTQAELHVWEGGFHGFEEFAPTDELSVKSRRARLEWVKKVWGV